MDRLSEIANFRFLIFIFLLQRYCFSAAAVDPSYEACVPRMCGKVTISYPFFIQGQQESFCGHPEFGISCNNSDSPMIHVPGNDYVIDDISYPNQTLRVRISVVSSAINCTLPQIGNITKLSPLTAVDQGSSLLRLLSNCTGEIPGVLQKYKKYPCNLTNRTSWGMAIYEDDQSLNVIQEKCATNVLVPVEESGERVEDNGVIEDYEGLLRRGFLFNFNWSAIDCGVCQESGGKCGFSETSNQYQFRCYCPDRPHRQSCTPLQPAGEKFNTPRKFAVGFGVVAFILLFSVLFLLKIKRNVCNRLLLLRRNTKEDVNLEAFLKQFGSLSPKRYSYSDIKRMTMSFKDKLGQGGYGTVYKGKLLDGRLVAVKILKASQGDGEEFINEVLSICRTSHINVVTFLGFCLEGKKRALVYEFMPNGSLEKFIHDEKNLMGYNQLGMDKLHQISLGVARGLDYLHQGCNTRILHFDIKPHNILLDKDFCPKISDFGLAKQCTKENSTVSILDIRGTIGYMAPELVSRHFGGVSYKSDVYSYGMMILEIVGRRKNVISDTSHSSEVYFPHWAYQHLIVRDDLRLKGVLTPEDDEIARKIILVGLWCIQNDPLLRPTMSKVIEMLEGHLQAIPIPPKAFFGSPSITPQPSFTSSCTSLVVSS